MHDFVREPPELEAELERLTGIKGVLCALQSMGIALVGPEGQISIFGENNWHRRGAETYSLVFEVENNNIKHRYIIKACVAGLDPIRTHEVWQVRRQIMQSIGINLPEVVYTGAAVTIEEYIPHSFEEWYKNCYPNTEYLVDALTDLARKLNYLGVGAVTLLQDLRCSDDGTLYLVDLGQDLGVVGGKGPSNVTEILVSELRALEPQILPEELQRFRENCTPTYEVI